MKKYLQMLLFVATLIFLVLLTGCAQITHQVCIRNNCFNVELAKTPQEQKIGLMNRTHLTSDKGMLFIFNKEYTYGFWMKDTLIPLDMLWINSNNTIVYIQKDAEPCIVDTCPSYIPDKSGLYVLEINSGLSDEYHISVGEKVEFVNIN